MNWNDLKNKTKQYSELAVTHMAVMTNTASEQIAAMQWFQNINQYRSEISTSMDSGYLKSEISKWMTPNNHRIMDGGHDFFSTIEKAQEIGDQNGWDSMETFQEWAKSYFTDLSSNAGMPMFGKLSDEIYGFLRSMNIDEETARDFVTVNGPEAIEAIASGAIASVAIVFAWKKEDKEAFSRTVGAILCSGCVMMNPAALIVAIIALAFGYNKLVCKESMARGAIITGVGLFVSTAIQGPALLGLVPAIVASVYVSKKMGKDFKPIEFSKNLYSLVTSDHFKKTCADIYEEMVRKAKPVSEVA